MFCKDEKNTHNLFETIVFYYAMIEILVKGLYALMDRKLNFITYFKLNEEDKKNIYLESKIQEMKIQNGIYYICSKISSNYSYVIDCAAGSCENGATVMLWDYNAHYNQRVRVICRTDGFYELEFVHSGKLIDVAGASKNSKAKVFQWERNGHYNQHWQIVPSETENDFYIIARHSGKYLSAQHKNGYS